jgi:general stress protein 26
MDMNDGKNNLYEVVNDFDVAMLVTRTGDAIHARPMAIARLDVGMGAYLVTDIHSIKVDEIGVNPQAVLTFQSARRFAAVRGELTVSRDRALI